MEKRRLSIVAVGLTASCLGLASPALAMTGVAAIPTALSFAAFQSQTDCQSVSPAYGASAMARSRKSAAILGGQPSQLELIAMQQAASISAPLANAATSSLPGAAIEPSAGGVRCQRLALPSPSFSGTSSGYRTSPLGADDFLASKRLSVRQTSFDAEWNRVRSSGLSRGAVAQIGKIAVGHLDQASLAAVNGWVNNHVRYVEDRQLYGKADYWANAGATLSRRAGDCEDIAIVKMQLLAAAGVPRSDMYLTIARDLVRHADHALLVVKLNGRNWLLDNSSDRLLDASESYDYRPILSFSSAGKWLHGY